MIQKPPSKEKQGTKRGLADPSSEPRFLLIGQIAKPHGVRGELSVTPYTDVPERFTWLKTVYLGQDSPREVVVEGARVHQQQVLLKLAGYDDRNAAETLRGQWLQVPEAEGIPLEEGEYYLYQLQGLAVYSEEGQHLGTLVEVLETKANNVFVVHGPLGEILLPDTAEVVKQIDFEAQKMVVFLMPGLLPN